MELGIVVLEHVPRRHEIFAGLVDSFSFVVVNAMRGRHQKVRLDDGRCANKVFPPEVLPVQRRVPRQFRYAWERADVGCWHTFRRS